MRNDMDMKERDRIIKTERDRWAAELLEYLKGHTDTILQRPLIAKIKRLQEGKG